MPGFVVAGICGLYRVVWLASDEEIFDLEQQHVDHYDAVRQGRPDR